MDATHRLAVYGSLRPGRPNHDVVARLVGRWVAGEVQGRLVQSGWGAAFGFPAAVLDPDGPAIPVEVL